MQGLKLTFTLLLFFAAALLAQEPIELDKLMTRRSLNCNDIYFNCSLLIPRYFSEQRYDSVAVLLDYWEQRCGLNQALLKTKLLVAIHQGEFNESLYDDQIIESLLYEQFYLRTVESIRAAPRRAHLPLFDFPGDEEFNAFTGTLARNILLEKNTRGLTHYFAEAYAGNVDSLFLKLEAPAFANTRLREYYGRKLANTLQMGEGHLSVWAGYWSPRGANRILGNHPLLGFQLGLKNDGWLYGFAVQFSFLNARQSYTVRHEGELVATKHFFGGFIGLEGGKELWRSQRSEIDALAGIGWDGFDALTSKKNETAKTINSLNLNLGLGVRRFLKPYESGYIGVEGRYNFVNYASNGGSDLSGNTITLRVVYGWLGNARKNSRLRAFGYEY